MPNIHFSHMYEVLDGRSTAPLPYGNVLILGTSTDGPAGIPRRVYNVHDAISIFQDGEIIPVCHEVFIQGASSVTLMRISGEASSTTLLSNDTSALTLTSTSAGSYYNDYSAQVSTTELIILDDDNIIGRYTLADHHTIGALCHSINQDSLSRLRYVIATPLAIESNPLLLNIITAQFSGGDNGALNSDSSRQIALTQAMNFIEEILPEIDILVPANAYADSDAVDFIAFFNAICTRRTGYGYGTICILPTIATDFISLNQSYTSSRFVSVIAASPIIPIGDININDVTLYDDANYIANGQGQYAGLISSLLLSETVDNKRIYARGLGVELTAAQRTILSDIGITTLRDSATRGHVVSHGVTTDGNNLYHTRIATYIENTIRLRMNNYIGQTILQAIEADSVIRRFLNELSAINVIRQYTFITKIVGHYLDIEIEVTPVYGIKTIHAGLRLITRRG